MTSIRADLAGSLELERRFADGDQVAVIEHPRPFHRLPVHECSGGAADILNVEVAVVLLKSSVATRHAVIIGQADDAISFATDLAVVREIEATTGARAHLDHHPSLCPAQGLFHDSWLRSRADGFTVGWNRDRILRRE